MINVPYLTSKQELELPRSQDTPVIGQKRKFKDQTTNDLPINADNKMIQTVPQCIVFSQAFKSTWQLAGITMGQPQQFTQRKKEKDGYLQRKEIAQKGPMKP